MKARPDTLAVHGRSREASSSADRRKKPFDAVPSPIVASSTFAVANTQEVCDFFEGRVQRDEYGRYGNPSVRSAEAVLAALEGAEDAALFSSGMAAVTTALLALLKAGDHVVLTADCYRIRATPRPARRRSSPSEPASSSPRRRATRTCASPICRPSPRGATSTAA
jgi:cystathionine beta-lyase/cystathionine gamma-synthase